MFDDLKVRLEFEKWLNDYKEFLQQDEDVCKHLDEKRYWIELGFQAGVVNNSNKGK